MIDFDEARSTNEYLIGELITARKQIEVLTEHIEVLTEHIETLMQDLKMSSQLLNACVAYMS